MNTDLQKLCASCGIVAMVLFFIGLIVASWIPVPSPTLTAIEVAEMYQSKTNAIRICGVIVMISTMFGAPFYAAISMQLRRMEGDARPVMSYAQLCAGAAGLIFFILPGLLMVIAAYRPERAIEVTYALNDLVWIITIMPWPLGAMQALIIGITIFKHHSSAPVFPRWLAFFNIWIAVLFIPGSLIPFFKTGPFAWDGILAFWIPATVFGLWYIVMQLQLFKAINTEQTA